jgi:nitrate/TMAO reductase-like tetraheme cytochrome c subunit
VSSACIGCHGTGQFGAPVVGANWALTKHGLDTEAPSAAQSLPYGSVCAGCHTANYDPGKVVPVPTATSSTGAVSWAASPSATALPQGLGNAPMSELDVGCSSCHYGTGAGVSVNDGYDANNTAHMAPYGNLADPQICGACHSRYSYTAQTYTVQPVPYLTVSTPTPGTPVTPNPSATTLIQPQMAIGYPMLGSPSPAPAWSPSLATYLTVQHPGWTPAPTATSAGFARLQTYWKINGQDSPWQQSGHDGSAAQYPEWASEGLPFGHADALTALTSQPFWASFPEATKQSCLECHSADFRILKDAGRNPTSADAKYGITCVGCHAPHDAGTVKGVWDDEFDAQLVNDNQLAGNGSNLCTECHNGEIPAGSTASPGAEVHHPMKEMMDGYGAIDVASFPSVHKGKCIQCHMPPTSYSRGADQRGGNHTFNIITPDDANQASPVPIATPTSVTVTTTPVPGGTPVITTTTTVVYDSMPYSACSTCHDRNTQPSPKPTATLTSTPNPTASPLRVSVTVNQDAAGAQLYSSNTNTWTPGGDRAQWLQATIEQRQSWTHAKVTEIHSELDAAAVRLGYANEAAAQTALVAIPEADRTFGQTNFLKSFTNVGYVESEGSYGIHNWDYSREIVNVALAEARAVTKETPAPRKWVVTLKASKASVSVNQKVKIRGLVLDGWGLAGKGTLTIQRKLGKGKWQKWATVKLQSGGKYGKTLKMTKKGTWKIRGYMPGDGKLNLASYSVYTTVKVK